MSIQGYKEQLKYIKEDIKYIDKLIDREEFDEISHIVSNIKDGIESMEDEVDEVEHKIDEIKCNIENLEG